MIDNATPLATLLEQAESYGKSSIELLKLNAIDKSTEVISSLVARIAIISTVALSLIIVNIGLALWLGTLLGNAYYGFFVVGGFYAILAGILHIFRKQLIKYPISNSIIKQMVEQKIISI